jgi:glycosyltransferase involved in cell wall biosynthesis
MLLSIIIPAYNAEKTIYRCLKSVTNNESDEFECIVINDGSFDTTEEIVKQFSKFDKRITYVSISNHGVSYARNYGLKLAKADYITFLDSDDFFIDKSLDTMINIMKTKTSDLLVFSYIETTKKRSIKRKFNYNSKSSNEVIKYYALNRMDFNCVWSKVFKSRIIKEKEITFPEDMKIAEDSVFAMKYLQYVKSISLESLYIIDYQNISGNTMNSFKIERFNDYYKDAKMRFSLSDLLKCKCDNSISINYIKLYILFFMNYSQNHKVFEIKESILQIHDSDFYHLIDNKIVSHDFGYKNRFLLFLFKSKGILTSIIFKISGVLIRMELL